VGSQHDFALYQDSVGGLISEGILFLGEGWVLGNFKAA